MLHVIDFETDDLFGRVTELCVLSIVTTKDGNLKIVAEDTINSCNQNKYKKMIKELFQGDSALLVWHKWHFDYVSQVFKIDESIRENGKLFVLVDEYARNLTEDPDKRYKIADITEEFLGKEHKGNAKDDAYDLLNVYNEIITRNIQFPRLS